MRLVRLWVHDPTWQRFVSEQPGATVFHHPAWSQLLAEAYGYKPFALCFTDPQGEIVAGLPVMEIRSRLTGHRYASLPFTDYCPLLMRAEVPAEDIAETLRREWDTTMPLEIRGLLPGWSKVHARTTGVRHTLALDRDESGLWDSFSRMHRQNTRRGEQSGVTVVRDDSAAGLAAFYQLQLQTRHRLGVPVQPWHFFQRLHRSLIEAQLGLTLLARVEGTPVAGAVLLGWNGTLIYKYLASDPQYWSLRPNNVLTWAVIRWACENGYHTLDFGRSDLGNQGLISFKKGWGAQEEPLIYSTVAERAPQPLSHRGGPELSWLIRHSPAWVCRALGGLLYAHFG